MPVRILPAEFVFPGHPDKLSDPLADALVTEAIRREPAHSWAWRLLSTARTSSSPAA